MSGYRENSAIWKIMLAAIVSAAVLYGLCGLLMPGMPSLKEFQARNASERIVFFVMACDKEHLQEGHTMLKSALAMSQGDFINMVVYFFLPDHLHRDLENMVKDWPQWARAISTIIPRSISLGLSNIRIEDSQMMNISNKLPCTGLRLLATEILPKEEDAVAYLDTDVLFLSSPKRLWKHFSWFSKQQIAAIAPFKIEGDFFSYYITQHKKYYPPTGLNAGVILMNLTRMRAINVKKEWSEISATKKQRRVNDDQDLMNYYFHHHPEMLYLLPCEWNYRWYFCWFGKLYCTVANQQGIALLHGHMGTFGHGKRPIFKAIYRTFLKHSLEQGTLTSLERNIYSTVNALQKDKCSRHPERFVKAFHKKGKLIINATSDN